MEREGTFQNKLSSLTVFFFSYVFLSHALIGDEKPSQAVLEEKKKKKSLHIALEWEKQRHW